MSPSCSSSVAADNINENTVVNSGATADSSPPISSPSEAAAAAGQSTSASTGGLAGIALSILEPEVPEIPLKLISPSPVVRGGLCTSESFDKPTDSNGKLIDLSVQYKPGVTDLHELSGYLPNGRVGVTSDFDVFSEGGSLTLDPTFVPKYNPYHAILSGITPQQACGLFSNVILNPGR